MHWPAIVELRRYELKPGMRETLIELFESELVETQEAAGMTILGQFRDETNPNAFVWLRGFTAMAERHNALARFYGGPAWAAHRDVANATMLAWDNVLLLRPLPINIQPSAEGERDNKVIGGLIFQLADASKGSEAAQDLATTLEKASFRVRVCLGPETSPNHYAPLPVRGDDDLLAIFALPPAGLDSRNLEQSLRDACGSVQAVRLEEVLRLSPTSHSKLR